ncbi:T9SS type A sorting domain-containing protein [Aequorivita todarodis]|uniref:T9SS type A sorting domain-containing protein n=1 Tax=Aequorivita todarodis TaxID=2036821 RepID=UPI003AF3303B
MLQLQLSFYDVSGRLVETINFQSNRQIDLSHLMSGVYFVKVQGNDASKTFKIIKY